MTPHRVTVYVPDPRNLSEAPIPLTKARVKARELRRESPGSVHQVVPCGPGRNLATVRSYHPGEPTEHPSLADARDERAVALQLDPDCVVRISRA